VRIHKKVRSGRWKR